MIQLGVSSRINYASVIKFRGPCKNGAPRGPRILIFWGPHCDFGAPFELRNGVVGRKVCYIRLRTCQE